MSLSFEFILYITYIVALAEVTLGLYVFVNNPRQIESRNVALLLGAAALISLGLGFLASAQNQTQATIAAALLSFSILSIQPLLIIASYSILQPDHARSSVELQNQPPHNRWHRWAVVALYFLAVLPLLIVLFDLFYSSGLLSGLVEGTERSALFFSGIDPQHYQGGYIPLTAYTQGVLGMAIRILYLVVLPLVLVGILLFTLVFGRTLSSRGRWSAIVQLITVILSTILLFLRGEPEQAVLWMIIAGTLYAAAYSTSLFWHIQDPEFVQPGSIVNRITLLVLVVSLPLMIALVLFTSSRSGTLLSDSASRSLEQQSKSIVANIETWLQLNNNFLENMAQQQDVRSMDPARQVPVLQSAVRTFPYMSLVSVSDSAGMEISRSDNLGMENNSARLWFRKVIEGETNAYQVILGQDGKPVIIVAKPVYGEANTVTGVIMFEADLDDISSQIQTTSIGETGSVFLVDEDNQLIAHPDPKLTSWLRDYGDYPPINAMRAGNAGFVNYLCDSTFCGVIGEPRTAFVTLLSNQWGLVIEQSDTELFAPLRQVQQLAFIILIVGLVLFASAVTYTVQRGLAPVKILTDTAVAITEGDIQRQVPLESGIEFTRDDDLGFLAQTFNNMTDQLSELIESLERRVEERTEDVKKRSSQLEAAAQVARASAGIRDLKELLTQTTQLISRTFGFYHAGIFIIDDAREYAVLQASNSPGGQKMLARAHKLRVGQVGIVGYTASTAQPRIALEVGEDAVFFNNPDLPETRSEMALPLIVNNQVIGVLDVQSQEPRAFEPEDVDVLQILADQLALAIENARLLQEARQALEELRSVYGERTREEWQDRLRQGSIIYEYNRLAVEQAGASIRGSSEPSGQDMGSVIKNQSADQKQRLLKIPIAFRDQRLGSITFYRDHDKPDWTPEEEKVAQEALTQVAAALENARLLEESQARSTQLRLLQEVTAVAASHTNLQDLLVSVVRSLRAGLGMLHCGVIMIKQEPWMSASQELVGILAANDSADPGHPANTSIGKEIHLFSSNPAAPSIFDLVKEEQKTRVFYSPANALPPGELLEFIKNRETATLLISPLVTVQQVVGFLILDSSRADRYYGEDDLQLFDQLCLQISAAIEMANTFEQTARRAEREKRTGEITSRIRETLDIDVILRTAAQEVRQLLDVPEVIVQLVSPEEETDESD
jgi:GAF domain-containing protein